MRMAFGLGMGGWIAIAGAATAPSSDPRWVFSLLPKALQRNPRLDLTVMTELTAEGRTRPEVTVQHPAYCLIQSGGYHHTAGAAMQEGTLTADAMDAFVRRALATRGYLPAAESAPASLVLVYSWGVHGRPVQDGSVGGGEMLGNYLGRASLIGGEKFRSEIESLLGDALAQADAAASSPTRHMELDGVAVSPVLGPEQLEFISPINRFRDRSATHEFLLEQVAGDVYFVVISAYDHDALAAGRRLLLWRTRMTVGADGVAQPDALPALLGAAAPYFGCDMPVPATLTPRLHRRGEVRLGPLLFPDESSGQPARGEGETPAK
jgi:hypothetical protein